MLILIFSFRSTERPTNKFVNRDFVHENSLVYLEYHGELLYSGRRNSWL